ncbi:MAG: ComF family protein [Lentisphaeria bacterium]|nr:ComF family protein [Lentisphaeria bacterium]
MNGRDLLRIFVSLECPVCGGVPFDGSPNMLCRECLSGIRFLKPPFCPSCGGEYRGFLEVCPECLAGKKKRWDGAVAAFAMTGTIKELLHSCKYQGQPELARVIGDLAYMAVCDRLPKTDCIVPVPLHWSRALKRGFNQSACIAERLSAHTGVPCEPGLLKRVRFTGQQAKLGRKERLSNLSRAFSVPDSTNVKNRAILLVDDVMTTGATLSAATQALKRAGAGAVYVFCAVRRQRI